LLLGAERIREEPSVPIVAVALSAEPSVQKIAG
jgi:hypothetical protein